MTARFAIYFAPSPASPLGRFGIDWLGRDYASGTAVTPLRVAGIPADLQDDITADARHYGFHATLKPPFALAAGRTREELRDAMAAFARIRSPMPVLLSLQGDNGFLALRPARPAPAVNLLADDCVRDFDTFRAPSSEKELAKRRAGGLSPAQDAMLVRWGYPYVMDQFGFHMTLTRRLDRPLRDAVRAALDPHVAPFCAAPLLLDAVALFEQAGRAAPFVMTDRFAFGG
jgi:putative phosphonate metabolism protein